MKYIHPLSRRAAGLCLVLLILPAVLAAHRPAPAAAFAGDNGRIAFQSMRHGNWELYTMAADGSDVVRLTNNAAADERPGWSPDGAQIVFGSKRTGNGDIYVMDADGSNVKRLTTHAAEDYAPQWSADGTKIVFRSSRDGNGEIYVMNADGTNQTNLTNNPANDAGPVWSPLGNKIAFSSNRAGNSNVYVMNTNGSGVTQLTDNPATDFGAAFSADGARIAFRSERDGNVEVYVMDVDGSDETNLTRHPADDRGPAWAPDGSLIAFYTNRDGNYELYTMRTDGSDPQRLTNHPAEDFSPDWDATDEEPPPPVLLPILLSAAAASTVDGLAFDAADILRHDPNTGDWTLHFDASDVGLSGNVSGLTTDGGDLLLSFRAKTTVPGVGQVSPRDVVRFTPTSLGATTAGAFALAFRGADWGLTTSAERLDALAHAPDGRLLLSTMGAAKLPGLNASNDDLLAFRPTAPTWTRFRALSALLGNRDLESVWFDAATGDLYIALGSAFSLGGVAGDAHDIVRLRPAGGDTYTVSLHWDGSAAGLLVALDAFELVD